MNIKCNTNAPSDTNGLVMNLISLRDSGKLWIRQPEYECDKRLLSDEGKGVVEALVRTCLMHDIAPFCSVSSEDLTCSADDIVSLDPAEYDDLLEKVIPFTAPTMATK